VDREPRFVLLEHRTQLLVNTTRQRTRNTRPDAQKFQVGNRPESPEEVVDLLGAQGQAVAAADEHVSDLIVCLDVFERRLNVGQQRVGIGACECVSGYEWRSNEERMG
jgi:hypothetical protein